ncbi:kinase-like domain-containing protein [Rhizophagus clarus]|uniref:Kinase-like domain-containing protein n=1 Tax=Rhizophagus clarus TaxID=94130 RepID=A0A8H3LXF4_9GLOM|nr:kinase-like domain-containing protein [Rhizophagus clarus]
MEKPPKNLWKDVYGDYQQHVIIFISEPEDLDERVVYIEDLEKRKQVYGICGECKEPEGGFGKIYSAEWPEGFIWYWDIKNHQWYKHHWDKYALKSLKNSSNISSDFLNEIKSYLQIYLNDIIQCYGITQDSNTREYIMVLKYCSVGNLRNYLNTSKHYINYATKIDKLKQIARGLLDIHNAGKKRFRPKISEDIPKLLTNLIIRCWDAEIKNRPTTKELYQVLTKWSRLLNFKNLPKPVNSSDLLSTQIDLLSIQINSANPMSECSNIQLSELKLNGICQDDKSNAE